jgi:hypothetical protein
MGRSRSKKIGELRMRITFRNNFAKWVIIL